eukprot:242273-Rhodomonas_salina.1
MVAASHQSTQLSVETASRGELCGRREARTSFSAATRRSSAFDRWLKLAARYQRPKPAEERS